MELSEANWLSTTGWVLALLVSFGCSNACAAIPRHCPERRDTIGVGLMMDIATLLVGLTGNPL